MMKLSRNKSESEAAAYAVNALKLMFSHVYYVWKILRSEMGYDLALKTYSEVWDAFVTITFRRSIETLGIKEIKDIPTLGKLLQASMSNVPALYEIVENSKDRHIGRVHWCANPAYGPHDCVFARHEYYRVEVPLTERPALTRKIAEARKLGFNEDIEIAVPVGRCRDGSASFCQIHVWKKGTPGIEPEVIPDAEKVFIEDEIGEEEPILYILRKQGKNIEDFATQALKNMVFTDMAFWDGLVKQLGYSKALGIYAALWQVYPPLWVKEAKLHLKLGAVRTISQIANVIMFCERKRFLDYTISEKNPMSITLINDVDPYLRMPVKFFDKHPKDNYFNAVRHAHMSFINSILIETEVAKNIEVSIKKDRKGRGLITIRKAGS